MIVVAAVVVALLVVLLVGRGERDHVSGYFALVSFVSLVVAAFGLVVALNGVVDVAVPGQIHNAGEGRHGSVVDGPGDGWFGYVPDGRVAAPDFGVEGRLDRGPMMRPPKVKGPQRVVAAGGRDVGEIRSRGWVRLLRGLVIFAVGAAVFVFHWRRWQPAFLRRNGTDTEPPPATTDRSA